MMHRGADDGAEHRETGLQDHLPDREDIHREGSLRERSLHGKPGSRRNQRGLRTTSPRGPRRETEGDDGTTRSGLSVEKCLRPILPVGESGHPRADDGPRRGPRSARELPARCGELGLPQTATWPFSQNAACTSHTRVITMPIPPRKSPTVPCASITVLCRPIIHASQCRTAGVIRPPRTPDCH